MKNTELIRLLKVASVAAMLGFVGVNPSYAAPKYHDPKFADMSYLYADDDIEKLVRSNLSSSNSYAAISPNTDGHGLTPAIVQNSINESRATGVPAVIIVSIGGSHWTALVIHSNPAGGGVAYYNNPTGNPAAGSTMTHARTVLNAAGFRFADLQVKQQTDSTSCGAYTVENLIKLAQIDPSTMTDDQIRAILAQYNDAKAIRLIHAGLVETPVQGSQAQVLQNSIQELGNQVFAATSALHNLTHHRLIDLHSFGLLNNISPNLEGISSGDDEKERYGIWIKGAFGNGVFKDKGINYHNKLVGGTIGFDAKVTEDLTLGAAVSMSNSSFAPKKKAGKSASASIYEALTGSIYSSFMATDYLAFMGSIEGGKLENKLNIKDENIKTTFKMKGSSFRGNLGASYYVPINSFIFVPTLGASYEQTNLGKVKQKAQGQNFTIKESRLQKLSVNPALKVFYTIDAGTMVIIPAISAGSAISVFTNSGKMILRNDKGTLGKNKIAVDKNSYNFGAEITMITRNFEFGAGYERIIQKKYQGNIGSVKLRVNF